LALFDLEVENIQAGRTWAVAHATTHPTATRLTRDYPGAGVYILNLRQQPLEQIAWLETAVTAARTLGDRRREGIVLSNLGISYADLSEVPKTIDHTQQALAISRELGDRRSEGYALFDMSRALHGQGETARAIPLAEQALMIYQQIQDPNAAVVQR
jgi:tetratricopeptide (TPR) repeat protein